MIETYILNYLDGDNIPCKCGFPKGKHKMIGPTYLYTEEKDRITLVNFCSEFKQDNLKYLELISKEKEK
jgi:hypothetical protein